MATQYHEPVEELTEADRDFTRALTSLKEEIEATIWYHERAVTTKDESMREVLVHNRGEEIEHACMLLEWLRRNMPGWDEKMKIYLFQDDPITELEEKAEKDQKISPDLGIGKISYGI